MTPSSFIRLALVALFLAFGTPAEAKQGKVISYNVINLTGVEKSYPIKIPPGTDSLDIGKILVGRPLYSAAAQIVISSSEQVDMATMRPVNIRIHAIESSMGGEVRLILTFSKIRIGKFAIDRNAPAASDPVVEIAMDERSTVNEIVATGGQYRSIMLRMVRSVDGSVNKTASVDLSRVRIGDLTVVGEDSDIPQPVVLNVSGELMKPLYNVKQNQFTFDNIQLRGQSDVSLTPVSEIGGLYDKVGDCTTAGRLLSFFGSRLIVGDPRGRVDATGHASELGLTLPKSTCLTLQLQDVSLYGNIALKGGVLNALALDNVQDHLGGTFSLQFQSLHTVQIGTASLNRVALQTSDSGMPHWPVIQKWGSVQVRESVALPTSMYDALSTSLRQSPDDDTSVGIRNFLVDARWKSFSSDGPERRAAPAMLYAVTDSDAHQIFGSRFASVLWFMTGYGQKLWLPAFCVLLLMTSPLLVAAFWWGQFRLRGNAHPWPHVGHYYSALLVGDNAALMASNQWLAYLATAHRVIIAVEVGLVTLFIQNAVLTGGL